jgi:hypothetical protein
MNCDYSPTKCMIVFVLMMLLFLGVGYSIGYPSVLGPKDEYAFPPQTFPTQESSYPKPLECGIQRETPFDTYMGSKLGRTMEMHEYDTNHDGQKDVVMNIPLGDLNRHPQFYLFDNNYDNLPDINWQDTLRDGSCSGMIVAGYRDQEGYWHNTAQKGVRCKEGKCYSIPDKGEM